LAILPFNKSQQQQVTASKELLSQGRHAYLNPDRCLKHKSNTFSLT